MKYLTLDTLADHPKNVRAKTDYPEGSISGLAASIKALGLLQSLVVQMLEDGSYGVLAGRRRMMAMRQLAEAGDLADDFKIPAKVIAKDTDHVTALSLAENTMQEPMAPLDEFEAFAAMIQEGETVDTIATTFGTTARTVKERLRYGLVHSDIRDALRAGNITLDVMKTYACHPCLETQKRVFDGFMADPSQHQTWRVRETLKEQDIRADDPLAIIVLDRYRERGGEMVVGLFEEDTVLKDRALAEAIRGEMLMEAAEKVRVAKGFKWAETRTRIDYAELSAYGRIYTHPLDLDEKDEARLGEIAERLDEIAGLLDEGQHADIDHEALSEEYDTLEEEADTLQNGYVPEQAAHAGIVVALASDGSVRSEMGLVRPEDYEALNALAAEEDAAFEASDETTEDASSETDTALPARTRPAIAAPSTGSTVVGLGGKTGEKPTDPLGADAISAALRADLGVERAHILHAELSDNPDLARDLLDFTVITGVLRVTSCYEMNNIRGMNGSRTHSRPEAIDAGILTDLDNNREALDLSFADSALPRNEQFRSFRELDGDVKAAIMAYAVGAAIDPSLANNNKPGIMEEVAAEAIEDIRALWRPTAANYWSRVSRDHMLALLKAFGLAAEAEEHRNVKKATLAAYMEKLFEQPFATLSEEQRIAVETWTPPGMGTQGDVVFDIEEDDDAVGEDKNAGEPIDPDGSSTYSNLEPGETVIGQNIHGETLIEDTNGVRSALSGGVQVTEPVPVIPGAGIVAPNPSDRKPRFLTVTEEGERKNAA